MDARTYLDKYKDLGAEALIGALNGLPGEKKCTVGYFKQIAYGYRRPSPELAEELVSASEIVAREYGWQVLDFKSLLDARKIHALAKAAAPSNDGEPDAA